MKKLILPLIVITLSLSCNNSVPQTLGRNPLVENCKITKVRVDGKLEEITIPQVQPCETTGFWRMIDVWNFFTPNANFVFEQKTQELKNIIPHNNKFYAQFTFDYYHKLSSGSRITMSIENCNDFLSRFVIFAAYIQSIEYNFSFYDNTTVMRLYKGIRYYFSGLKCELFKNYDQVVEYFRFKYHNYSLTNRDTYKKGNRYLLFTLVDDVYDILQLLVDAKNGTIYKIIIGEPILEAMKKTFMVQDDGEALLLLFESFSCVKH